MRRFSLTAASSLLLLGASLFLLLLFLKGRPPPHSLPPSDPRVHVAFFGKYAYRNMKLVRGMTRLLSSVLGRTAAPLHLHVMLDPNSRPRAARTLRRTCRTFGRKLNVTFYDVVEMAQEQRGALNLLRRLFFRVDVGRYGDDIFFLSPVFHEALPRRLHRILFLDLDVVFRTDVQELYSQFDKFLPTNVIGIAPDLQPQYRDDFKKYRKAHPGTPVGSPRPGRQGFNTGVVLFDLQRMRDSTLYNSLLNATRLQDLCDKFQFRGYLGHQDFFTVTGMEHPELYHDLDCSWNRQLDSGWREEVGPDIFHLYHQCPGPPRVLHANGNAMLPADTELARHIKEIQRLKRL